MPSTHRILPRPAELFPLLAALSFLTAIPVAAQTADSLPLTLDAAIASALRTGDEARAARLRVDVADAQVTVARAAALPQLRVNATQTHVMESARAQAVGAVFNQPNTYNTNASISQPLFQGGRLQAGRRAARRVRESARLDESEDRAQVVLDVQRAYLQALFTARALEIQTSAYALAGERVVQAEQFERAGRAARYDVLRARVEQANIEPNVIQARGDAELAQLELKRLINTPLDRPLKLVTVIDSTLVQRIVAQAEGAGATAERAAVRSAELVAAARRDAVTAARADLLPSVTFNAQLGYLAFPISGFPPGRGRLEPVACPPGSAAERVCTQQNGGWFPDRSMNFAVSLPVFDGLRARGNIDLARAQSRLAELDLARERERVRIEVAGARENLDRAKALYSARRQTVSEADEAFRLASLRFARGLGTQLEVSDAQLALITAQMTEARAIYDLYLAAASLSRALGASIPAIESTGEVTN
ncbi:MAG: TolC family protein [Gemmatimonadaceae bacterium]